MPYHEQTNTPTSQAENHDAIMLAEEYAKNYAIFNGLTLYRVSLLQAPVSRSELPYLDKLIEVVDEQITQASQALTNIDNR